MAQTDLQAFLQERLRIFDENMDVSSGSRVDVQVIQPILRRLGTDPFTVDLALFMRERLAQEFPDLAVQDGDALVDALIKPATLLWDPIVRENLRVRKGLSFKDPDTLNIDEAAALGANLFTTPNNGSLSKGQARIYFSQPQKVVCAPTNFFTSSAGLHYFPTSVQAIQTSEMMQNVEGSLYYFDVDLVAEMAGDEYNISAGDLISVANLTAVVRVTNKRRFRNGAPAETTEEFIGRAQQGLTERSLVTERGINAQIPENFPEVTRVATVGMGDPEMQRDVITGGNLGPLLAFGANASTLVDGENKTTTRIFTTSDPVDFTTVISPPGSTLSSTYVLTVNNLTSGPAMRDIIVSSVIGPQTLSLSDQVLVTSPSGTNRTWSLRKKELTLSSIPGGIISPNGPNGTVAIKSDEVHIGGAVDVFVRGPDFDAGALTITNVADENPALTGVRLLVGSTPDCLIGDYYYQSHTFVEPLETPQIIQQGDAVYTLLEDAQKYGYPLQIISGPNAGTYRIERTTFTPGYAVSVILYPKPPVTIYGCPWRIINEVEVDLVEPKDPRCSGSTLSVISGSDLVTTTDSINFTELGVSVGDVLKVTSGENEGSYTLTEIIDPFSFRVALKWIFSESGVSYQLYSKNSDGGIVLPLVRINSIDILDSTGQKVGSTVPYAKPVDVRSTTFANPGHGIKALLSDAITGIVTEILPSTVSFISQFLAVYSDESLSFVVPLNGTLTPAQIKDAINAVSVTASKGLVANLIQDGVGYRIGIASIGSNTYVTGWGSSAMPNLFGSLSTVYAGSVRSPTLPSWATYSPAGTDSFQVLSGFQIGSYSVSTVQPSTLYLRLVEDLYPEIGVGAKTGSRSTGSARLYFMDPTSIEFDGSSRFSAGPGATYIPDPAYAVQRIPAPPNGSQPKTGQTAGSVLTDSTQDFITLQVAKDDLVTLTYVPFIGTVPVPDPVPNLVGKNLIISVNGGPDRVVTFTNDSGSIPPTDVSRDGVVDQINNVMGSNTSRLATSGLLKYLELEPTDLWVIRSSSTAPTSILFAVPTDRNNRATDFGTTFKVVNPPTIHSMTVTPAFTSPQTRIQYQVIRSGVQRISSTDMANKLSSSGLYYYDVELVSEGTGDEWNLVEGTSLIPSKYRSDGYYLTTEDSNLTFSASERPRLHISPTILEIGVNDDPSNATKIPGQNLQISYDYSSLVESVNSFVTSDSERVVCSSPLARHLIPHFVRFDVNYSGFPKETDVLNALSKLVSEVNPDDYLEVSDVVAEVSGLGADSVTSPIEIVALVHNVDRSITADRSKDKINTGRLAAFIPDRINVKRKMV